MAIGNKIILAVVFIGFFLVIVPLHAQPTYKMPAEDLPHEGIWLQWTHQYEYGATYRNRLDATWVAVAAAPKCAKPHVNLPECHKRVRHH